MLELDFSPKQKISNFLALTFIMFLSVILGWYSVKNSEEIIFNNYNPETLKIQKIQKNTIPKNITEKRNIK
jgi:hypothetical protein